MSSIGGAGVVTSSGGGVLLLDPVVSRGQLGIGVVLLVPSGGAELRQQVLLAGLVALGVRSGGVLLLGHGHGVAGSGGVPEQRLLHRGAEATSRPVATVLLLPGALPFLSSSSFFLFSFPARPWHGRQGRGWDARGSGDMRRASAGR